LFSIHCFTSSLTFFKCYLLRLQIVIHPDENGNDFVIGVDGYVRVQLNNNTESRIFSHGGPYDIQNVVEGVHHLEVLLLDMYLVPIIRNNGDACIAVTKFAFKPNEDEMRRRKQIHAMEKLAIENILTGGRVVDHNNKEEKGEQQLQQHIIEPARNTASVTPTIDSNSKRRQYALSAIGAALRAKEITKKHWKRIKKIITDDRTTPNMNFRDVLADVYNYDAKENGYEFAQNLVLEIEDIQI
jgi:hypothetical protein